LESVQPISIDALVSRYEVLLLDAYGVLVHSTGALPGAIDLTHRLQALRKPFFVLTNDASKLPTTAAERFQRYGLAVEADDIITSGSLLTDYFTTHGLHGASCVVLGPADSARYVELAGGRVVRAGESFDVLVVADESGFPFLDTLDAVLSSLCKALEEGRSMHLILPNPDLIYPKAHGEFGVAAGSIATMLESALSARYPLRSDLRFARLGKPHSALFSEALRRSGTRNMVMVGDQLETDIKGAAGFGIDSAWISSAVTANGALPLDIRPTFRLLTLESNPPTT